MRKLKILVCSYFDGNSHEGPTYRELSELTYPSIKEYCKLHGYDFYSREDNIRTDRIVGWERIQIICDFIDKYDYIFYFDCDCLIMNHNIKIENLIDENYDFQIAKNSISKGWDGVNTGTFIVKCSQWSKEFFNKLNNKQEWFHKWCFEQAAIIDELANSEDVRNHTKIENCRKLNAFHHVWYDVDDFQFGDFIIHDAGTSNNHRFKLFTEMKNKIIKNINIDYSNWKIETERFI